jgi:hypothetical protein
VVEQSLERTGKFTPVWIEQGKVEEPRVAFWRRCFAPLLDEADVVVVASGSRKKDQWPGRWLLTHVLGDLHSQYISVESDGPIEIAGPKCDVPDARCRMDRCFVHVALPLLTLFSTGCTPFSMCLFLLD